MISTLCKVVVRGNSVRFGAIRSTSIFSTLLSCEMNVTDKSACRGMASGYFDFFYFSVHLDILFFFRHLAHGIVPLFGRLLYYFYKKFDNIFYIYFPLTLPYSYGIQVECWLKKFTHCI
jgi:hypothetical protein